MKRFLSPFQKNKSGEIMLESTIVMVIVLILLMVLLSLCFMFYQQAVMTSIANELSSAVAKNYKYYQAEPDTNQITVSDAQAVTKYRLTLGKGKMERLHNAELVSPANKRFSLSSFGFNAEQLQVDCEIKLSGIGRAYVKVTVKNNTEFFLSGVLEWAGIYEDGFTAVSYAEVTDLSAYTATVNFANYVYGGLGPISGIADIYGDLKGIVEKLVN